jgi:phosphate transport system protein
MTREAFDRQIQTLLGEVLSLGRMVEEAIINSVDALKRRDLEVSKTIYSNDKIINEKRFQIEMDSLTTIATQAPMAKDLRVLASIIDIAGELERMGDYAKGIALINIRLGNEPLLKPLIDIPKMAEITVDMLHRALDAFVSLDAASAIKIPENDDKVDDLYNQVYRDLLTFMISDPQTIDHATYLIWVAHNLERSADRVTNICERTLFIDTGEIHEIKSSDDEILKETV